MRDTIQDEKFFENRINETEDFISKWKTYLSEDREKKHGMELTRASQYCR
ncbi:hypothetical protein [Actinobacillus delphinicola]|uniref:Uncharacterized protein n=1 Tax=Actinobacillus delphinicola TaxID=51161 RepID=A0A448TW04_9PAST|nr:hypothetical protein [Actinobacillus delphinicola]VEJ10111.1 Uncharacterised protein [Actinobacillus delphinicola]